MSAANRILIASMLVTALPAFAADTWIRLSTPNFELYTVAGDKTPGEKNGRAALLTFEQVRALVLQATRANWDQVIPVRIISFQADRQFKPYAPNNADTAYSSNTQSRDYFVMVDSDPDHLPVSIHQYVHLALQHSGPNLPLWLVEGWADVFSTLQPAGTSAMTGTPPKDYVPVLKSEKWLDFNTLAATGNKSPNYNEQRRTGVFYAESWALVHMLYLGRDYRENFGKLLDALSDGKPMPEAFQTAYSLTPAQVYADLQAYVRQNGLVASAVPAKLEKGAEAPSMSPASDLETGLLLADLLSATSKHDQAKAAYEKLAKQYPGSAAISESLGYLAWQDGDSVSARRYFEEALPQTKNPQMCYHLAMLDHDAGAGAEQGKGDLIAALSRAVALKPDYAEARLQLGIAEYNRGNYDAVIAALSPIERIAPEHAAALRGALASARAQTSGAAREASGTPPEPVREPVRPSLRRADGSSELLEPAPATPVKDLPGGLRRVEGEAQSLDCDGPHPKLVVLVGAATMTFEIPDPKQVTLRHEGSGRFEFVCGPMNRFHVVVDYTPDANVVKAIEF